jgi:hypothetical protein
MTRRFALPSVLATCALAVACLSTLFAGDAAAPNWKGLEIRYAQANVELAMARLAQAESQNNQAADTITPDSIDMLKAGVKLTQDQLQQLQATTATNPYGPQIAAAEEDLKALVDDHNESVQANKLQAGAVPDPQLRREQAEIDVATARLVALKSLAQQPLEVRLEWEIGQLQDQVRALWARPLIQD